MSEEEVITRIGSPQYVIREKQFLQDGTPIDTYAMYGRPYHPEYMRYWDQFDIGYAHGKVVSAVALRLWDGGTRGREVVALALYLLMLAIQARAAGTPAHVLDLVVATPQVEAGAMAADALEIPGGLLPLNHRDLSSFLRLHLESIEPMDLAGGDRVVYQITIENVDRTSIQLPWSPTNEGLKRTMPGSMVAVLSLAAAATPNGPGDLPTASQPLYGAPQVADSVVTLEPGEYARVRVSGHWTLQSQIRERVGKDATLRVVGTLMLYLPMGTGQVRSIEEVTVGLTR